MIDRYLIDYHHTQTYADLVEDEDGDYVLYEDHISEIETLRARIAELERSNDNLRQIERNVQAVREHEFQRAEKAEAALTEARARLAAADRMAEALAREAIQAYRKETGHDE